MKQVKYYALIAVVIMTMIIAGCSSNTPPKEALQAATLKTMEAESYKMSMTMQLDELEISDSSDMDDMGISMDSILGIIKDVTIKADVIYAADPLRADINLEVNLPGMMDMKLAVPMIVTDKQLYVKIPSIPMLGIPETIANKYVLFDLQELAEQEGANFDIDFAQQQKIGQELSATILKHFDEKTYFSELMASEAGLPDGMKADQVVKFAISQENYGQTVETIVNSVLPEILDILISNQSYLDAFQLKKADIEELKSELNTNKTEILNVLQNDLKINTLELTGAIQDKYLVHQGGKISVEVKDAESGNEAKFGLSFSGQYSDLNKKVSFEQEIPTDALTMDQLTELFGAGY